MEKQNSKLLLANCYMIKENARLRRKAQILDLENQALLTELKKRRQQQPSSSNQYQPGPSTAALHDDLGLAMATAADPDTSSGGSRC
ncbi:hypothetical protein SAY87_027378 [Trapa incisa]|uniref:Uncharacterized protein n=1 Tax=Trapa incisa TaxID=236973 RepID=A0AAN7GW04_9MYRT|nr:hypothetical protein SAY87_027378 [Trapa incisa]